MGFWKKYFKYSVESRSRVDLDSDHKRPDPEHCVLCLADLGIVSERMASQTQGIQQLLAAEKRAAEKVNAAIFNFQQSSFEIWLFLNVLF